MVLIYKVNTTTPCLYQDLLFHNSLYAKYSFPLIIPALMLCVWDLGLAPDGA